VTVTFLRMDMPPMQPAPPLPPGCTVVRLEACTVAFYRYLYDTVGAAHVWWLRRTLPDDKLAALLRDKLVTVHVLYQGGEPRGFFELDARVGPDTNLSYFGLLPEGLGRGWGVPFLRAAVDAAWALPSPDRPPRGITVNTCTADHPRALPAYLKVGFRAVRSVRELWDVPVRLGLAIPEHLRA
jgi:GNAT superfamily N-acetyltransferase